MIDTRVFDIDAVTKRTRLFHFDTETEDVTIETVFDATDVIEQNKALSNEASGWKGDFRRVASIPMPLYFDLKRQGILDDPKAMKRWLNDRDNRLFRTQLGTV